MLEAASLAFHLSRAVAGITIMAMLNHSHSVQSHAGLCFCSEKIVNRYRICI